MQRLLGLQLKVTCDREALLEKLRTNRARHKQVVIEARKGYIEEARKALKKKLDELESGKLKSIQISLSRPQDMSSTYDTVIQMLEMHKEDNIKLSSDEVRMFVEDKWDWTSRFLASNAAYSELAASMIGSGDNEED